MRNVICCFAGHREINSMLLKDKIREKVLELIQKNHVTEFWVGNYGAFDWCAASVIYSLKKDYPEIELHLVIPYLTKEIETQKEFFRKYDSIILADIPSNTPRRYGIIKANQFMVNHAQYLICYVQYAWGGAAKTLEYAEKKSLKIFNLATN